MVVCFMSTLYLTEYLILNKPLAFINFDFSRVFLVVAYSFRLMAYYYWVNKTISNRVLESNSYPLTVEMVLCII